MARIKLKQWREDEGLEDKDAFMERLEELVVDSVCPALCDEGCEDARTRRMESGGF